MFFEGVQVLGWSSKQLGPPKISSSFSSTSEAEIPIEQRGDEEVKYAEAKRDVFGGMVFEKGVAVWM